MTEAISPVARKSAISEQGLCEPAAGSGRARTPLGLHHSGRYFSDQRSLTMRREKSVSISPSE